MWEVKAPKHYGDSARPWVFLAGSMETGNWQKRMVEELAVERGTLLNPSGLPQRAFDWELEAQERADLIVVYFTPETKSADALIEMGLFSSGHRMVVCCPEGFWQRANVEAVCNRYHIPGVETLDHLITGVKVKLEGLLDHSSAEEPLP